MTDSLYECDRAGCSVDRPHPARIDLNENCPKELAVKNAAGQTVGCMTGCQAFGTDEYCCQGAHGTPETCDSRNWPVDYPALFRKACPEALKYRFDNTTTRYHCRSKVYGKAQYEIRFCPEQETI